MGCIAVRNSAVAGRRAAVEVVAEERSQVGKDRRKLELWKSAVAAAETGMAVAVLE